MRYKTRCIVVLGLSRERLNFSDWYGTVHSIRWWLRRLDYTATVCWLGCLPTWFAVSRYRMRQHGSTAHFQDTALRAHHWRAHLQPSLASRSGAHLLQDRRNDLPSFWTAVHQRICRHTSPVSLTCHPGRDSGRLPLTNLLCSRSTSLPWANGLFQFPTPTSGTVFPSHVTSALSLAIFRQRLNTFLFHLSYPDLLFWFSSCFAVDL